jgi:hypothetical protein
MVVALAKIRSQGSFRRNLTDNIDAMDYFARTKGAAGKDPQTFNGRVFNLNGILGLHSFSFLFAAT